MNRGKAVKPLKELNLTNRFLFDEVMEDAETHRTVKRFSRFTGGFVR